MNDTEKTINRLIVVRVRVDNKKDQYFIYIFLKNTFFQQNIYLTNRELTFCVVSITCISYFLLLRLFLKSNFIPNI